MSGYHCTARFSPRLILGIMTSLMMLLSTTSYARLNIEITQGMVGGVPIAIAKSVEEGEQRYGVGSFEEIAMVIRNDLQMSGRFAPIHPQRLPPLTSQQHEMSSMTWQQVKAENAVLGTVIPEGNDRYTVNFKLLDVYKTKGSEVKRGEVVYQEGPCNVLLNKRFNGVRAQDFRALAHHVSDLIYEQLTGIRGAFSTRIAYVMAVPSPKGMRYSLEVADADGFNPQTLVQSAEPIMSPSWSKDGKKMAFVSFERHRAEIYTIDVQTGQRQLLSKFPGINGAPAWSPDGRTLAVVLSKEGSPKIFLMDLATRQLRQLTTGYSIDTEPAWSMDGSRIYFTSNRGGKPQIYQINVATGKTERVTFVGNYNARPMLSADGRYLVMMHRGKSSGHFNIATQDLRTGHVTVLTHAFLDESPTLSPNGAMVLYGTQDGDRQILGLVTLDGRGQLRLPAREGSVQEPAWSPFLS